MHNNTTIVQLKQNIFKTISVLKDELADLRRDHKALLKRPSNTKFLSVKLRLWQDIMNLRQEKVASRRANICKHRPDEKLKQALNDQRDTYERELELRVHEVKSSDDVTLKALADQLAVEKAQRLL